MHSPIAAGRLETPIECTARMQPRFDTGCYLATRPTQVVNAGLSHTSPAAITAVWLGCPL